MGYSGSLTCSGPLQGLEPGMCSSTRRTANSSSRGIVEALDVVEDGTPGLIAVEPDVAVDELALERREEGLRHGVVVGVADRAHGADQPRLAHPPPVVQRGVLAALVGVVDHARVG